jgi:hypothetical protein
MDALYLTTTIIPFLILFLIGILVYFIPTIVASKRKHINKASIVVINIFLGWTLVGWVVALVWVLKKPEEAQGVSNTVVSVPAASEADELIKYKKLLDEGVITQEEFEIKKKSLLGL